MNINKVGKEAHIVGENIFNPFGKNKIKYKS